MSTGLLARHHLLRKSGNIVLSVLAAVTINAPAFAGVTAYEYDALGRVTKATFQDGSVHNFEYDWAGNRTDIFRIKANGGPIANADATTTLYLTSKTIDPRLNDSDPDGDALTITAVGTASHGTTSKTSGTVTYVPAAGWSGLDTFTYTISDGQLTASATVNVTTANAIPVANADTISTPAGTAKAFDPRGNDTDANPSDVLSVKTVNTPAHGTAVKTSASIITYTPTAGYVGADSFTYNVNDTKNDSNFATVNVTVSAVNAPPVAVNDTTTTPYLTAKTLDPRINDTDANGDTLSVTAVGTASHGTTQLVSSSSVKYTPAAAWSGSDSFSYTISDGNGGTDSATITVTTANAPPVTVADTISTNINVAKTFDPRTNDSDPNGTALTITNHGTAAHGAVAHTTTSVTYTPTTGYTGTDTFTYTVSDGAASTNGTVNVTVLSTNHAPVCTNYLMTTGIPAMAGTVVLTLNGPPLQTSSCTDADGDTLTQVTPVYPLSVTTYPNSTQTIPFTVSDGQGGTGGANLLVQR